MFTSDAAIDYPQPLSWNGNLRVYYHYGSGSTASWRYRVSTDEGQTFGAEQTAIKDSDG